MNVSKNQRNDFECEKTRALNGWMGGWMGGWVDEWMGGWRGKRG